MRSENGQSLILLLVFFPLLLLIFRLVARSGATMLYHDQVENHCDRKILEALAMEAKGLEQLGNLNSYARTIIRTRRVIDKLAKLAPELIPTQLALMAAQRSLSLVQKGIKAKTALHFSETLLNSSKKFKNKIQEIYKPIPLVNFHLKDEEGYEGEIGAPLQPAKDFEEKSSAYGKVKIFTERFLSWWPEKSKASDMILECKAQIQMQTLEDTWHVQLVNPMAKPLSNSWPL